MKTSLISLILSSIFGGGGTIRTREPDLSRHNSFQNYALMTTWVLLHIGREHQTRTDTPHSCDYSLFSKQLPYRLGLVLYMVPLERIELSFSA